MTNCGPDYKVQLQKHLCNLPCPICQRPVYFYDKTLRNHLSKFHKRIDIDSLILVSKKMCGIED